MPRILDLAIGIVFVFLLFSLVVTAANEIWLSLLDKRAAFLKDGLEELLRGNGKLTVKALLDHGLISALSRGNYDPTREQAGLVKQLLGKLLPSSLAQAFKLKSATEGVPSYIPGKSFVLAVISLLPDPSPAHVAEAAKKAPPLPPAPPPDQDQTKFATFVAARKAAAEVHASLLALPDSKLRTSLLALYDDAANDLDHFKANLENWFNESMDRVGGWYKRYAQQWLLTLSLLLAIICNVDSIRIIRALSADPKLLQTVVEQATKSVDAPAPGDTSSLAAKVKELNGAVSTLEGTGIPIGWSDPRSEELLRRLPPPARITTPAFWAEALSAKGWDALGAFLGPFAGWLITALAASLGAPFWFDTLNRFIDIRGVGRAPEEKDSTAPKKRADDKESYLQSGDSKPSGNERGDGNVFTIRVDQSPPKK